MVDHCSFADYPISIVALIIAIATAYIYWRQLKAIARQGELIAQQSSLFEKQLKFQAKVENERTHQRRRDLLEKYQREAPSIAFDSFSPEMSTYSDSLGSFNWILKNTGDRLVLKSVTFSNPKITLPNGLLPYHVNSNELLRLTITLSQEKNHFQMKPAFDFTFTIEKDGIRYYIDGHHDGERSKIDKIDNDYARSSNDSIVHKI